MSVRFQIEEKLQMAGYTQGQPDNNVWSKQIGHRLGTVLINKGSFGSWVKDMKTNKSVWESSERLTYANVEKLELIKE